MYESFDLCSHSYLSKRIYFYCSLWNMDDPSAENCWEEDGGMKNVNGDCGRQGLPGITAQGSIWLCKAIKFPKPQIKQTNNNCLWIPLQLRTAAERKMVAWKMSTVIVAGKGINRARSTNRKEYNFSEVNVWIIFRLLLKFMDTPLAKNCSWEEDGGVKNVNGDCGRQGNKSCAFNKPRQNWDNKF